MNVWMNGVYVGFSKDSCLPCEFDVTDAVGTKEGTVHILAVQVMRWCDGSYMEDQDKWWLSGIYREVYLLKRPSACICDYEFTSEIISDRKASGGEASITIDILAEGMKKKKNQENTYAVRVELYESSAASRAVVGAPVLVLTGIINILID